MTHRPALFIEGPWDGTVRQIRLSDGRLPPYYSVPLPRVLVFEVASEWGVPSSPGPRPVTVKPFDWICVYTRFRIRQIDAGPRNVYVARGVRDWWTAMPEAVNKDVQEAYIKASGDDRYADLAKHWLEGH